MGRVDKAETGTPTNQGQDFQTGTPTNQGQQVGSYPQNVQTGQSQYIGAPFESGLFDCHLDQTNGNIFIATYVLNKIVLPLVFVPFSLFPCI